MTLAWNLLGAATAPWMAVAAVAFWPCNLQGPEVQWIDGTLAVVHDKVLLNSDLVALLMAEHKKNPEVAKAGKEQAAELQERLLDQRIDELLQIQACRDVGFDPVRIEELVEMRMDDFVQSLGGAAKAADYLARESTTPKDVRDDIRERMLAVTWRQMVTGEVPGTTGRVERDRFVRPGQLWAVYQIEKEQGDPRWMELLGGEPERVVLQSLVLEVGASGTKAALEQAESLRREALEGADFGQLVRTWSLYPAANGIAQPHPVSSLASVGRARHGDDRLGEFVRGAAVGDIAPAMVSAAESVERPMVFLYKLVERQKAHLPAFQEQSTQERLEREIQRLTDERRERTAMRALREALLEGKRRPLGENEGESENIPQ